MCVISLKPITHIFSLHPFPAFIYVTSQIIVPTCDNFICKFNINNGHADEKLDCVMPDML